MSTNNFGTHRYPLRARTPAVQAMDPGERAGGTRRDAGVPGSQAQTTQGSKARPRDLQDTGLSGVDTPAPERHGDPAGSRENSHTLGQGVGDTGGTPASRDSSELSEETSLSPESEPPQEVEESPPRRRARVEIADADLMEDYDRTFDTARDNLTNAERERIDRRFANISVAAVNLAPEGEAILAEGTSKSKGKSVDPHNWGDAQLTGDELDPEIQQQILENCNRKTVETAKTH